MCARHLFEEFRGFDNLKEFTPDEFSHDDPQDPDAMIKAAVQNVRALTQPEQELIMKPIIENAQKVLEDRYKGEKVNFPKDKRSKVYHCIRFLVQYGFYGKNHLVSAKLLPEKWGKETSESEKTNEPSIEIREGKSKLANLVIHLKKRLTKVKTK